MSELQLFTGNKFSPQALEKLQPTEKRIATYSMPSDENPRISDMSEAAFTAMYAEMHRRASIRLGTSLKGKEVEVDNQTAIINEDLQNYHPTLTYKEFLLALDNGLNGMYREKSEKFIFFSPSNLMQWISAFIIQTKTPVIEKVQQIEQRLEKQAEIIKPTEFVHLTGVYKILLNSFVIYFEKGTFFVDHGGLCHDLLIKFGLLQPLEATIEIMKEAATVMLNQAIDTRDRTKINECKKVHERVFNGEYDEGVFQTAQRKHFLDKFKSLCEDGEDNVFEFMEILKSKMTDYFVENNLHPNKKGVHLNSKSI